MTRRSLRSSARRGGRAARFPRSNRIASQVERWADQGVGGVAIHAALWREHGYRGSYSSVRRMLAEIHASAPPATTVRLYFAPAEAAQVDFGAGPFLFDPARQRCAGRGPS